MRNWDPMTATRGIFSAVNFLILRLRQRILQCQITVILVLKNNHRQFCQKDVGLFLLFYIPTQNLTLSHSLVT